MAEERGAVLRLAGMALAHAMWSVDDGATLCTMAMVEAGADCELVRYEADTVEESVDLAHGDLRRRLRTGGRAALVMYGCKSRHGYPNGWTDR